jgi:hypothetical protein
MAVLNAKTRSLPLRVSIGVLTVAAAIIHLSRAVANPRITVLFTLNAAGYLLLLALFFLPVPALESRRGWLRWIFIGYAGVTFVLFFVWGVMKGEWPAIGWVDKVVELALIALLWQEGRGQAPR